MTSLTLVTPHLSCELLSLSGGDHERLPTPECGGDVPQCPGGGGALGGHGIPAGWRSHAHHQRD